MVEPGGDPHFAEKAIGADDGAQVGTKHFDGDLAVVLQIAREVDGGHAARADLALDGIPVRERGSKMFRCGHWRGQT